MRTPDLGGLADITRYISPNLGNVELQYLNQEMIHKFYHRPRSEHNISERTIKDIHVVLHNSLHKAVQWGYLSKNVATFVEKPRARKKEVHVWNELEMEQFLINSKNDPLYVAFLLALSTGMRQAEILGLRWKDVDLNAGIISVNQTLSHDGKKIIPETKTRAGNRSITLPTEALEEIRKHKSFQAQVRLQSGSLYQNNDLIVCTMIGTPIIPRNLLRSFYRLIKNTDIPRISFHDLRHTHASLLLKQNVHPKVVSERLGHADIRITLDTYSHLLPNMQSEVAKNFGKMFLSKV